MFGVDVLRSVDGAERLRIGFDATNQSLVIDHALAWAGGVSVPSSRHPFPRGMNATELAVTARQTAPVPSNSQGPGQGGGGLACQGQGGLACELNITILVDGGLVESYTAGVVVTSFASPSPSIAPADRVAALFGVGGANSDDAVQCALQGRKLSL